MEKTTPFVKKFRTQDSYYVYDANTSRILFVSPVMYDIVDLYWCKSKNDIVRTPSDKHSSDELEEGYQRIAELATTYNLFSPNRLKRRVGIPSKEEIEESLNQGIMMVCLEVTESCNMRCKYCAYSGEYLYDRRHGSGQMSFATAKAAVDFYLSKSSPSADDLPIGFYGGEPLLRFDLIRGVIEYTKSLQVARHRNISFNLTTNATLLNDEMIEYFAKNDVFLTISLDGPQQDHDRHRVFENGKGSFDKVIQNVEKIRKIAPKYYRDRILFSCVLSLPYRTFVLCPNVTKSLCSHSSSPWTGQ